MSKKTKQLKEKKQSDETSETDVQSDSDNDVDDDDDIKYKINIKCDSYTDHSLYMTELVLRFTGTFGNKPLEEMFVNTICRTIHVDIPTYGVGAESVLITKNQTIYDQYMVHSRLMQIPIPKIAPDIWWLEPQYYPYVKGVYGKLTPDKPTLKHPQDNKSIRMVLNVDNAEVNDRNVTTSDMTVYVNDKETVIYDKYDPILLFKLKQGEKISFELRPLLGIGSLHKIWNPVSNSFIRGEPGNVEFIIRSYGQISEPELVIRACKIINKKLDNIMSQFKDVESKYEKEKIISMLLDNETETLGELLTYVFKLNKNIIRAGYTRMTPLVPQIKITVEVSKAKLISEIVKCIKITQKSFSNIQKQIQDMNLKPKIIKIDIEKILYSKNSDSDDE